MRSGWLVGIRMTAAALATCAAAPWAVALEWVSIGDPGNAPDTRYDPAGFGAVAYTFRISKYEVTSSEYAAFLNAEATLGDPHGLYNPRMAARPDGCGILRVGKPSYTRRRQELKPAAGGQAAGRWGKGPRIPLPACLRGRDGRERPAAGWFVQKNPEPLSRLTPFPGGQASR